MAYLTQIFDEGGHLSECHLIHAGLSGGFYILVMFRQGDNSPLKGGGDAMEWMAAMH